MYDTVSNVEHYCISSVCMRMQAYEAYKVLMIANKIETPETTSFI